MAVSYQFQHSLYHRKRNKMERWIDLHIHSLASDGTWTAQAIVQKAAALGLAAVSIVDHDTMAATADAMEAGRQYGVEVIPGVEISAKWDKTGTLHILGYFCRGADAGLQKGLDEYRRARDIRNPKIVDKLRLCGIDIVYEEVAAQAPGEIIGRPHIAAVLLKKGYVASIEQAFAKYLKRGARAYVEKDTVPPKQAIDLIRSAGGVAVLAHPKFLYLKEAQERQFIEELAAAGLGGIEAYYPGHTPEDAKRYVELAGYYDLALTGGTDFHGDNKPEVQIGTGFGELKVPEEILEGLRARAALETCHSREHCPGGPLGGNP